MHLFLVQAFEIILALGFTLCGVMQVWLIIKSVETISTAYPKKPGWSGDRNICWSDVKAHVDTAK